MANKVYYLDRDGATPQVVPANTDEKLKVFDTYEDIDTTDLVDGEIVSTKEASADGSNVYDYIDKQIEDATETSQSYSTEETLTGGKWIDGKPIYRRVIEVTNITVGDETTVATLADHATIDYITFKYDAVLSATTHVKTTGFFSRLEEGGAIVLKMEYVSDTGKFIGISQPRTFSKIYITIEYTKTTD